MADVKSGVMRILCQLSCPTCHAGTSSIIGARDQIILGGLRKEGPHRGGLGPSLAPEEVETGSRTADPQAIGIESDGDAVDQ